MPVFGHLDITPGFSRLCQARWIYATLCDASSKVSDKPEEATRYVHDLRYYRCWGLT